MREMTQDERRAFLMEGTRTGKLGITRRDGQPYVLPVWFVLDGDDVVFMTGAETVRGRALRRDATAGPRCASTRSARPTPACASTAKRA